jgi:hypothetical protein
MALLKAAMYALDPTPDEKNQLTLLLNLLFELSEQKAIMLAEQIENELKILNFRQIRKAPAIEILARHAEHRAYKKQDRDKIADEVFSGVKRFLSGGSKSILDGISNAVANAIKTMIGVDLMPRQEMIGYYLIVQQSRIVRFDIRAWSRQIEAKEITREIETSIVIVAYKSRVDTGRITLNNLLVAYMDQLSKTGVPQSEWNTHLEKIESAYRS